MTPGKYDLARYVFPLLFLLITLSLINSFYIDKHLSADGVNFFATVLDTADFTYYAWSRQFAHYLVEWPLLLAVRLGVNDIPILIKIYALGIYIPYLISFGICAYALRDEKKVLLLFPLASMVAVNLPSDYILAGEHQVMVNLSWPIIFILLRRTALTPVDGLLLWILLIIFSRLYETAIIPALICIIICVVRLYYYRQKEQKIIIGGALSLCLVVCWISLYFILNPRDPANTASFINGIKGVLNNLEAVASASFVVVYAIGLLLKNRIVIISAILPLIIYAFVNFVLGHNVSAEISCSSRTLSIIIIACSFSRHNLHVVLQERIRQNQFINFCSIHTINGHR